MSKNDGGPAFPIIGEHGEKIENNAGMSMRDYYAAAAFPSVCILMAELGVKQKRIFSECEVANVVFKYADAMIAERNNQ